MSEEQVSTNSTIDESAVQNEGESNTQDQAQASEIPELETLGKIKFDGREWTPEELRKSMLMHKDYTQKTQQVSQARRYYDNLGADLDFVRSNPNAADDFRRVYPKEFHRYLDIVLAEEKVNSYGKKSSSADDVDDDLEGLESRPSKELMEKLQRVEQYVREQEVKTAQAQLDAKFQRFNKQYPMASQFEDLILARAQVLNEQGVKLDDSVWEKLFKQADSHLKDMMKKTEKTTLEKQREANRKGKGIGRGGGTPGEAPQKITFEQATEQAIRDLTGR